MTYIIERVHERNLLNSNLKYHFREQLQWSVLANHYSLWGFCPGKLTLLESGKEKYTAMQQGGFYHFCGNLPILNMFFANPYIIMSEGNRIGTIRRPSGEFGYVGVINNIPYEYRLHSHYIWSLTCANQQIAVVKYKQGDFYTVQVNAEGEKYLGLLLLLCGCFDRANISIHPIMGTNYIPRDKYRDRALWQP